MIIEYTPDGEEPERFDAGRLRASEIQAIERTMDGRWPAIKKAMGDGDIHAMRTVAWVIKKREHPDLRFGEFDPFEGELRVRLDDREVRDWAEYLLGKYGSDPDDLAQAFDELRDVAEHRDAAEAAIADVTAPKDPAPADEAQSPASPSES